MRTAKADLKASIPYNESLDEIPTEPVLDATVDNLEERGFAVLVADAAEEAAAWLRSRIPAGASVMTGHSNTLEEIGFTTYLMEGDHEWENLRSKIRGIDAWEDRLRARRMSVTADYNLGSVNAIAQTGELVAADHGGARVSAYPFAAEHLILVSGINKIVPDLDAANARLAEVAYPLEDARSKEAYGKESFVGKQLIYRRELLEGRTTVVLVRGRFGF